MFRQYLTIYAAMIMRISLGTVLNCAIGVLAVSVCSQAGGSVEVEAGDNVTLWCRHGLAQSGYLFWYKHTGSSAPDRIACRYYKGSSSGTCFFRTTRNGTEMMVNSENSSLTIRSVTDSDSGLYYCVTQENKDITFTSATLLQLKERTPTPTERPDRYKAGSPADAVFPLLTLLFGAVNAVLLSALLILIFINQSYRKELREHRREGADSKSQENESLMSCDSNGAVHTEVVDPYVQCYYKLIE